MSYEMDFRATIATIDATIAIRKRSVTTPGQIAPHSVPLCESEIWISPALMPAFASSPQTSHTDLAPHNRVTRTLWLFLSRSNCNHPSVSQHQLSLAA